MIWRKTWILVMGQTKFLVVPVEGNVGCARMICTMLGVHPIELCQNCAKTLSNCDVGVYFEREADSPKLLKTLERQNKGRNRWNGCSCLQSIRPP